jgi:Lhr-like helicase
MAKPRRIENLHDSLPDYAKKWFSSRGWQPHRYQGAMVGAFVNRQSTLLIAPTGGGKTQPGFLPSMVDCHETRPQGKRARQRWRRKKCEPGAPGLQAPREAP